VAQLVFEFGCETIEPVIQVVKMAIGSSPYKLTVMPTDSQASIDSGESIDQAASRAKQNILSTFTLRPEHPWIRHALVFSPFFAGGNRTTWMGVIEITTKDYQPLWSLLLRAPHLQYVCLGFEEGVDLSEMQNASVATFPWHDEFLVLGAVRSGTHDPDGWHIEKGPRYLESLGH
jgi:hypothetical protein